MGLMWVNPDAVGFKANDGNFNGRAVQRNNVYWKKTVVKIE